MEARARWLAGAPLAIAAAAALGAAGRAVSAPTFGISGDDRILWVWQTHPEPGAPLPRVILAHSPADKLEAGFSALPLTLFGQVRQIVVVDQQLCVFYGDGAFQRYHLRMGQLPGVVLPRRAVPIAACVDAADPMLYAAVPADTAVELLSASPEPEDEDQSDEAAASEPAPMLAVSSAPSAETAGAVMGAAAPSTPTALVRYENGQWLYDRELPADLYPDRPCWLSAEHHRVTCLFAASASGPVQWAQSAGTDWTPPEPAAALRAHEIVAVLPRLHSEGSSQILSKGDAVIVALQRSGTIAVLRPFRLDDGQWRAGEPFVGLALPDHARADDLAAAALDGRIALARLDAQGQVAVGVWPAEGGAPSSAPQVVKALRPPSRPLLGPELRMLIAYALLIGVASIVFARRREHIRHPAPLPAGQMPARPLRRIVAFALDVLIASPLLYICFLPWIESLSSTALDSDMLGARERTIWSENYFWPIVLASLAFSIYATVFEAAMGATPGKRVLNCQVVDERGQRCGFRAALLRNLLRLLEFYPGFQFVPPLALVLFTPQRQRLGDLVAKTVVVQPATAETPPDMSDIE
ncbi:MAG TPA: RDD family protein [Phycisphaerae bacterium]|jgi:uncharacterized RDD family membrane protein YckC